MNNVNRKTWKIALWLCNDYHTYNAIRHCSISLTWDLYKMLVLNTAIDSMDGVSLNDPDIDDEYLTEVLQDLQEIEAK